MEDSVTNYESKKILVGQEVEIAKAKGQIGRLQNFRKRPRLDAISNEDIIDGLRGRLFDADQIETVEQILNDMRYCLAREEGKEGK